VNGAEVSQRSFNFSVVVTLVAMVVAFFFTAGYIVIELAGVSAREVIWSVDELKSLTSKHAGLLFLLAAPAVYCTLVLLSLIYHKDRFSAVTASAHQYVETPVDRQILDANKLVNPADSDVLSFPEPAPENTLFDSNDKIELTNSIVTPQKTPNTAMVERLKKDLVIAEQQAKQAQASKSQFLANMSHELRTPMNGILGMTELLMGSGLENKQYHFADSVRRSSEALLSVINDLLDYSRMEAGSLYLEKASFNLRELIEDVCDLHAVQAQLKEVELICHIDRAMHDQVIGDANRIRQLLNNLISNAVKFTKEGEIVVRLKQSEFGEDIHSYEIDVIDTGQGISPEGQARIFDSFTQADDSNAREHGGSGLGLFISHKLLELMGGKISLRSRMGEGSHFKVSIALKAAANESESLNLEETLRGVRVLVVDDNETNRTILFHQLKSWGVVPETVESAELALRTLRDAEQSNRPFEVAILDLHMPGMDGLELTRRIQADSQLRNLKRLMLTSATLDLEEQELVEIGISQYISKPARQTQLYTALASLVPTSNGHSEIQSNSSTMLSFKPLRFSVLLAEDNIINQEVAQNMLENFGCDVEVVSNGQAALEACEKRKFDIIMMDCSMPVVTGLEATKILRESAGLNAQTPVLALTANVSTDDEQLCIASGMNDYICKPVKQNELYRRLECWSESVKNSADTDATVDQSTTVTELESRKTRDLDSQAQPADKILNMSAIENIRRLQRPDKPDLVAKVVDVYLQRSPQLIDTIIDGVEKGNLLEVGQAAHSLKSSTAYIGADDLAHRFEEIEQAVSASQRDSLKFLTRDLKPQYERLVLELKNVRDRVA